MFGRRRRQGRGVYDGCINLLKRVKNILKNEKENNIANKAAVGVYSVNGSITKNNGKINVGGKNSIRVLRLSYKIDLRSI